MRTVNRIELFAKSEVKGVLEELRNVARHALPDGDFAEREAVMLAIFGVVLWWVDARSSQDRGMDSIGVRSGFGLGVAQAVALQPGVSRSGITMTAARWIGLDRESAARFSFLLAIPIIAGAGLYKGLDLVQTGFQGYASEFVWGFVSSAVSGFV